MNNKIPSGLQPSEAVRQKIYELVGEFTRLRQEGARFVPGSSRVQYAGRVFDEEELAGAVGAVLDAWWTLGPRGERLEAELAKFTGVRDTILVNSGSSANLVAVAALASPERERPLAAGDEVLTPAVTFPSTVAPLVLYGLIPVFVDCELGTYNVSAKALEAALSPKVRAMMIPHTLGNMADMDFLMDFARRHQLLLIEDACDALGSEWDGRRAGTFGELATLSLYPAHHMTMGEGGAIFTNDEALAKAARSLRDWGRDCWCKTGVSNTCGKRFEWQLGSLPHGYDHKYIYSRVGFNLKPTDIQAAIGLAQMKKLPRFITQRRENFQRLHEALKPYEEFLILPSWHPKANPSWFGYPITVRENQKWTRQDLVAFLESRHIETRAIFAGNLTRQPAYQSVPCRVAGPLTNSDTVMNHSFFIGVYPGIDDQRRAYMIESFHDFFKKQGIHAG